MAHVLVLDDDPLQLELTAVLLKRDGHEALTTADPETAVRQLESEHVDLVLFELNLSRHDGYRVGQRFRHVRPSVPIMVTGRGVADDDVVRCLLAFADVFVEKPYQPRTLLAHVHSLLRRAGLAQGARAGDGSLVFGSITLNQLQWRVSVGRSPVPLTPREVTLLAALMSNPNRVLSRTQLIRLAWGDDFDGGLKTVDVFVQRLRKKLEKHLGGVEYIHAVRGFGYKMEAAGHRPLVASRPSTGPAAVLAAAGEAG